MRLTTVILIATLMQVSAAGLAQKITMSRSNASLRTVLKDLRTQSGYNFVYADNILSKAKPVDISVKGVEFEVVLKTIFSEQPLTYTIDKKTITVTAKEMPSFLDRIIDRFNAIDVRGVVVDSLGNPLQGATVKVKGSNTQVNTSAKGEFYIVNVDENAVLIVSYVGYVSREVKAAKDLGMIRLVMASADLEEVAVVSTGYQDIPKERATGSFVLIDNKMLNQQTGTDILKRLDGITSGLAFDTKSDEGGRRKLNLTVRGVSTINGPIDPLVVLDGFIYEGGITNINPNDIENITILKDAAAASIWGARAGNGVIVITSKRGKFNQKTQVDFNSTVTISQKPDLFKLPQISSSDYVDVEKILFDNGYYNDLINYAPYAALSPAVDVFLNRNGRLSNKDSIDQINYIKGLDVRNDYSKYFYRSDLTQQYSISLRGGSTTNTHSLSVGYDKNLNEDYSRFNKLNIKAENVFKPLKDLQFNVGIYITSSRNNSGRPGYNTVLLGGKRVPYLHFTDSDGNPASIPISYDKSYLDIAGSGKLLDWQYSPLEDYKHSRITKKLQEWYTTTGIQYKFLNFLSIDLKYQYQRENAENEQLNDIDSYYARNTINTYTQIDPITKVVKYIVPLGGIRKVTNGSIESHTARGQLSLDESFGESNISAIMGTEIRAVKTFQSDNLNYGYVEDPLTFSNVDYVNYYPEFLTGLLNYINGPGQITDLTNRFISYYSNVAYAYKNRYIFSGSARQDGANIFGADINDRWKPLWSVGTTWRLSKEPFYKSEILPILNLRVTFGKSGNVDLRKSALPIAGYSVDPLTNLPTAVVFTINDPSLRWEQVKTLNFGIDFSFKKQILSGTIEYYQKKSSDLYGSVLYDYSTWGRTNLITKNIADMQANGIELSLITRNIDRAFKWQTNLLFNYSKNKTLSYPNPSNNILALIGSGSSGGNIIIPVTGMPLYSIAAYKWGGLDASGKPQGYVDGKLSTDYAAIKNEGREKGLDGNIIYIGSTLPVCYGSLLNSFSLKSITLSVNISYRLGYYFKNPTISYSSLINTGNGHSDFAKRWQKPGDELTTNVPVFNYPEYENINSFYGSSEVNILKGDHIRLQYINLSYSPGQLLLNKSPFKDLQLYINASNMGILWRANQKNADPEYSGGLAPSKTFALGIRGSF